MRGDSFGSTGGSSNPTNEDDHAPLWNYVTKIDKMGGAGGNTRFRCNYCQVEYKGSYLEWSHICSNFMVMGSKCARKWLHNTLLKCKRKLKKLKEAEDEYA